MNKLTFQKNSYVGNGSLSHLKNEIEKLKVNKLLVVTDQTLMRLGIVDKVMEPMKDDYVIDYYSNVLPEPSLESAESLVEYTRLGQFDLVIGIGGGSALDLAKLAAVLASHSGKVENYLNLSGDREIEYKGLPKIMIPTTSGTGSEVTDITVFSLENTKDVVSHPNLLADVAIVDPVLTLSVPARVTAATGVDALTHAIEAYLSVNANEVTDALAEKAIKLIGESIVTAVEKGEDLEAREKMGTASYLAGIAFFNAGVGGVHALAYPLGNQFKIPHGESNAVLLPYVLQHIETSCADKLRNVYRLLKDQALSTELESGACIRYLKQLLVTLNLPTSLQEYGIKEEHLHSLTEEAEKQKRLLARSPVPLEKQDIYAIYQAALIGS